MRVYYCWHSGLIGAKLQKEMEKKAAQRLQIQQQEWEDLRTRDQFAKAHAQDQEYRMTRARLDAGQADMVAKIMVIFECPAKP